MQDKNVKIGFAFIKATEGINNTDINYRRNWVNAREANVPRGAYHFFISSKSARRRQKILLELYCWKKEICRLY
ncbi:MAG: GH25 family lysozyme [Ferruginibacter sp.]